MAYGGDEIGAIVLDVGSNTLRAGFSGAELPQVIGARKFLVLEKIIIFHMGFSNFWV